MNQNTREQIFCVIGRLGGRGGESARKGGKTNPSLDCLEPTLRRAMLLGESFRGSASTGEGKGPEGKSDSSPLGGPLEHKKVSSVPLLQGEGRQKQGNKKGHSSSSEGDFFSTRSGRKEGFRCLEKSGRGEGDGETGKGKAQSADSSSRK